MPQGQGLTMRLYGIKENTMNKATAGMAKANSHAWMLGLLRLPFLMGAIL